MDSQHSPIDAHYAKCSLHREDKAFNTNRCLARSRPPFSDQCWEDPRVFRDGFVPVCHAHKSEFIPVGRCQALMECGMACMAHCVWSPPIPALCTKHWLARGVVLDMPCHLLRIPVELRLRVLDFVLNDPPIVAKKINDFQYNDRRREETRRSHFRQAVLRTCRQLNQEGTEILYKHIPVPVIIQNQEFYTPLKIHKYGPTSWNVYDTEWKKKIRSLGTTPFRSFTITIRVVFYKVHNPTGVETDGWMESDGEPQIYYIRDQVRALADTLQQLPLRRLQLAVEIYGFEWTPDESLAAAQFLVEPFRRLRNVVQPSLDYIKVAQKIGSLPDECLQPPARDARNPQRHHAREIERYVAYDDGYVMEKALELDCVDEGDCQLAEVNEVLFQLAPIKYFIDRKNAQVTITDVSVLAEQREFVDYVRRWESDVSGDSPVGPLPQSFQLWEDLMIFLDKFLPGYLQTALPRFPEVALYEALVGRESGGADTMKQIWGNIIDGFKEWLAFRKAQETRLIADLRGHAPPDARGYGDLEEVEPPGEVFHRQWTPTNLNDYSDLSVEYSVRQDLEHRTDELGTVYTRQTYDEIAKVEVDRTWVQLRTPRLIQLQKLAKSGMLEDA